MNKIKPVWRKACAMNGQCVEVARLGGVAVRDSKHPTAHLKLTPGQFGRLINHLKEA